MTISMRIAYDSEVSTTMLKCSSQSRRLIQLATMLLALALDALCFFGLCLRPVRDSQQKISFFASNWLCIKIVMSGHGAQRMPLESLWSWSWFDWRQALSVVQSKIFIRWHRQAFRWFWKWKLSSGPPSIPPELQALIRQMAYDNLTWGQERIANELLLKLGLRVSPRTVRKYMPKHLIGAPVKALRCNAGRRLCAIMPRPSWPATSVSR